MENNTNPQKGPLMREKRNVYIGKNRTSLSFEIYVWENIDRIAREENLSVDDICSKVEVFRTEKCTLSTLIRFIVHEVTENRTDDDEDEDNEVQTLNESGRPFPSPLYSALAKLKNIQTGQQASS